MDAVSNRTVPGISEPVDGSSDLQNESYKVSTDQDTISGLQHEGIDVYCSPRIRRKHRTSVEGASGPNEEFDWLETVDHSLGIPATLHMTKCKSNQDINSEAFLKESRKSKAHSMLLLKESDRLSLHNSCCNLLTGRSDQKRLTSPDVANMRSTERDQSKSCNDLTKAFEKSWGRNLLKSNCTSNVSLNSHPSTPGTLRSSRVSLLSANAESYDELYNQAFNSTFVSGSTEQLVEDRQRRNQFVRDWLEKTEVETFAIEGQ
ncbi:uncharacterized protein LOC117109744 [Anneissia japonica]|uniref:uncharacterized protein LOC117109744 n=1 Tax=Anneissia japonica TaxID=1529436 RepID=UPI001425A1BF|nr:uncharacterized protein LOC117109744 [Anneissia japonica]